VREALLAGRRRLDCLWIRAGSRRAEQAELVELARSAEVIVEVVDRAVLEDRVESEGYDQGVALRVGPLPELSLDELVDYARRAPGAGSRLVLLDGVEDPQNVGALARVAESAGAHGLILTERRAPALTPAVSRASAGAIEWLRVGRVSNLGRALSALQENDYWIVAAAPAANATLFEMDDRILTGNLAVVLGAEGKGIRRSILEQADHLVEIPMRGKIASLNVSTAAAIILYDLLRRSESAAVQSDEMPAGVG
jgi:23S rRNA (guanosine2251-2'-O)-methyltransferase